VDLFSKSRELKGKHKLSYYLLLMLGTEWHIVEFCCCGLIFHILSLIDLVSVCLAVSKFEINSLGDIHRVIFDTNDGMMVKLKKT
jgi:hypothetical protein